MSFWESVRSMFTPGCAPPIPQDPEVGTPKPQNPHRRRMEFGEENDDQVTLPLKTVEPLHSDDLQGGPEDGQLGSESRYQTLDQPGDPGAPAGLFSVGQGHQDGP